MARNADGGQVLAGKSFSTDIIREEFSGIAKGVLEHELVRFTDELEQVVRDVLHRYLSDLPAGASQPNVGSLTNKSSHESNVSNLDSDREDHEWMQRPWYSHFYSGPARQLPPEDLTAIGTPKKFTEKNLNLFHRPKLPDEADRRKKKRHSAPQDLGNGAQSLPTLERVISEPAKSAPTSHSATPISDKAFARSVPDLRNAFKDFRTPPAPPTPGGMESTLDLDVGLTVEEVNGSSTLQVDEFDDLPETKIATAHENADGYEQTTRWGIEILHCTGDDNLENSLASTLKLPSPQIQTPASNLSASLQFVDTGSRKDEQKESDSPVFTSYRPRSSQGSQPDSQHPSTVQRLSTGSGASSMETDPRPRSGVKKGRALKERFELLTGGRLNSFQLSDTDSIDGEHEEDMPPNLRHSTREAKMPPSHSSALIPRVSTITRAVRSEGFDYAVAFLVALSAVLVGVRVDHSLSHVDEPEPVGFQSIELIFCLIFVVEIVLRILTNGPCNYLCRAPDWRWNCFDTLIVGLQLLTEVLERVFDDENKSVNVSVPFLRMLRLLRYVRIVRLVRIVHFVHQLRTMVASVAATMRALCWTMVLVFLMIYIVGALIAQVVVEYARSDIELLQSGRPLDTFYGSLPRVLLSLYQAFTGGIDWDDLISPLINDLNPVFGVIFCMYIAFAVLAMLNVITGVFVESALTNTKIEDDIELVNNMRELFKDIDVPDAGSITWDQFRSQLTKPEMEHYFEAIDLDISEARGLFKLLDLDDSGSISVDEFVMGCLRLRGPAKAIDLATLMYDNRRILQRWRTSALKIERTLHSIASAVGVHTQRA